MNAQHKTGAWTCRSSDGSEFAEHDDWYAGCDDDNSSIAIRAESDVVALAIMRSNEYGSDEELYANAYLIAAAPDLLRALETLVEAVEMDVQLFDHQPHKESRLGIARAAIAKARGESVSSVAA